MRKTILIIGIIAFFNAVSVAQTKNDSIQQLQRQIVNIENLNSRLSILVNAANTNIKKLEGRLLSTIGNVHEI